MLAVFVVICSETLVDRIAHGTMEKQPLCFGFVA